MKSGFSDLALPHPHPFLNTVDNEPEWTHTHNATEQAAQDHPLHLSIPGNRLAVAFTVAVAMAVVALAVAALAVLWPVPALAVALAAVALAVPVCVLAAIARILQKVLRISW